MRERCAKCGRLLPIGQLHRVDGQLVCVKEGACKKAQERLGLPQVNAGAVVVAEATAEVLVRHAA